MSRQVMVPTIYHVANANACSEDAQLNTHHIGAEPLEECHQSVAFIKLQCRAVNVQALTYLFLETVSNIITVSAVLQKFHSASQIGKVASLL